MKKRDAYKIILASGSPRREELLEIAGWKVSLSPVVIKETVHPNEDPESFAKRLALEKAEGATAEDGLIVMGADTIVILGDRILGKPLDEQDAVEILEDLRGKVHHVITAIAVVDHTQNRTLVDTCATDVLMRNYNREEIEAYVASGSPLDKAGAYGIQDGNFHPVELNAMEGCFANVMGLPLCHLVRLLRRLGITSPERVYEKCMEHTKYNCQVHKDILQREI